MTKEEFFNITKNATLTECLHIARKYVLHGIPKVFLGREEDYYDFRSLIASHFNIGFHEVFIVGSAKLGFSYHKDSVFSLDSDIDVVLVNERLFESFYSQICDYQYDLDLGILTRTAEERKQYNSFLKYLVKGWMRPDKLPPKIQNRAIKSEWFDFFRSLSNGQSCVGNYKVSGGLFKNYSYLEKYYSQSIFQTTQNI